MHNVKAEASRSDGIHIYVKVSGDLPNPSYEAKIVDIYPGGDIRFIKDPGSAQVFIQETRKQATGPYPDVVVPWVSYINITDKVHKEVTVFINDNTKPITKTQVQTDMADSTIRLLHPYGLAHLLTDQDDPHLWLAAAKKHWAKLNNPKKPFPRVLFGVGNKQSKEEGPSLGGMNMIQEWLLIRTFESEILPIPIEHMYAWYLYPQHILQVSRPSAGQATAIVHEGSNEAPLSGRGEARIWKPQADGTWIETDDVVARWYS
jgi:hypothetical protein